MLNLYSKLETNFVLKHPTKFFSHFSVSSFPPSSKTMSCVSSSFAVLGPASAMTIASSPVSRFVGVSDRTTLRYDHDPRRRCSWTGIQKKMSQARNPFPRIRTASASAYPLVLNQLNKDSPRSKKYKEVIKSARKMFTRDIKKDSEISIAKVLLYIAAEDEAFLAFNREVDAQSVMKEWESVQDQSDPSEIDSEERESVQDQSDPNETDSEERESVQDQSDPNETDSEERESVQDQSDPNETDSEERESVQDQSDPNETDSEERESVQDQSDPSETDSEELLQLDGKSISEWLSQLDAIAKEVEAELVSRADINSHTVQVLEAVNVVLFDLRGFERTSVTLDPKYFYLYSVLNCRCGTAFLFSVIYIEVCQRLGVPIVGSRVGGDFLIWPKTVYPEELFKTTSGKSLFAIVNGKCVDDPGSMASNLTGKSLLDLDIATNRDIIGIALANLIRVHWRRAAKSSPGLMLTSPLRQLKNISIVSSPLLRPQDLRLAIAAAERLLILEPGNWRIRRDLGMMLYYLRQYGEAIQELSICMAFVNEEEEKVLKLFVEKLHLLRLISSLKSPLGSDRLTVP